MGREIYQLDPATLTDAANNNMLIPLGPPTSAEAKAMTVAQAKAVFQPDSLKYVADGSEGTSVVISAIAGKYVLLVVREGAVIFPVASAPDSLEFTWDGTTIVLGAVTNPLERFIIFYKTA